MIVTLTPNPSIDRAIVIDALRRGEVHRATSSRVDPGGKGVNVSRALAAQGAATARRAARAAAPRATSWTSCSTPPASPAAASPSPAALRMNISVLEPDGTTTKLNEPGPTLDAAEVAALLDGHPRRRRRRRLGRRLRQPARPAPPPTCMPRSSPGCASAASASRSTPPGAPMPPPSPPARTSIKPNHEELAELVGHPLPTLGDVRAAARDLVADGIEVVAVSLGGDGALLVTADEVRARPRDHHGPPVHRGRRRLHARRPAPRPVERAPRRPTPSPPPSRGAPPRSPSPAAACRPRTTSSASPSRSPAPPTPRSSSLTRKEAPCPSSPTSRSSST